jgi:hypothetical protein
MSNHSNKASAYNNRGMAKITKILASTDFATDIQWLRDNEKSHAAPCHYYISAMLSGKKPDFEIGKPFYYTNEGKPAKCNPPTGNNAPSMQYALLCSLHLNKSHREAVAENLYAEQSADTLGRKLAGLDKVKSDKPAAPRLSALDKIILEIDAKTISAADVNRLKTALGLLAIV